MLNAQLRIRAISDEAFDAIMELLRAEAKDVRVETWRSDEPAGFVPRGPYPERPLSRGRR